MSILRTSAPPTGLSFGPEVTGPLRLGITGGIGSGKSTVARLFAVLGAPLYFADERARKLMEEDEGLVEGIRLIFGEDSYDTAGRLNRPLLSAKAFADKALQQRLNALVHPAVEADYERWASRSRPGISYTVKEAALLFEAGTYRRNHFVLHVSAPEQVRIYRTLARDLHRSREQVEGIIRLQMPETEREARSQLVVQNSGQESLIEQVEAVHAFLLEQAARREG